MERDIEAQERVDDMAFDNEEQMMLLRQELENKEFEQLLSFSQKDSSLQPMFVRDRLQMKRQKLLLCSTKI